MATPAFAVSASDLEVLVNGQIPKEHYGILASMLNESWGWLVEATPELMAQRIKSGFPIMAGYDARKPDDFIPGVDIMPDGKIPVVILETVALTTRGLLDEVPRTYAELTRRGTWQSEGKDYDTLIMVDLTATPSRRGKKGNGEVARIVAFAKDCAEGNHGFFKPGQIRHVGTYSPALEGVIRMHVGFGAKDSGYRIPNARNPIRNGLRGFTREQFEQRYPNHKPELNHVNINVYRGFGF